MYLPTYPTNRKKIKCLDVERRRRRAFWSSASCPNIPVYPRSEEDATLPNQFRSKPPPLILFPAGLIHPWSGVISVVHLPKKSPLPQPRSRCFPARLYSTSPPPSRLLPAERFRFESRARRPPNGKGTRIKGSQASSSHFALPREPRILLLVSIGDTSIIYTGRYNCTNSLEHGGIQGNVVPETMVHRLPAFLRLLLFEMNFSKSYCLSVFHLEIVM